jgi:quinol monooxygenase YgiN
MNAKTVTVVATFQARPGRETELRKALLALIAPTHQEAGCLNYDLHVSPDDPAKFLFHENWYNKEMLDVHLKSPHVAALLPRIGDLCVSGPEIKIWEKIG